jgi:hypothetical protein
MGWVARVGLGARAAVYLIMGALAVAVAAGDRHSSVDQRGALRTVLHQPFGTLLVWLLACGFLAYSLWRFSEVAFGPSGEKDGLVPRAKSLVRGAAYCVFAIGAFSILMGSRESQSHQQEGIADTAIHLPGGQVILGLAGACFVAAGILMVWEGATTKFLAYFDYLPPLRRTIVVWLGRVGTITRGIVFAFAGGLVVLGAWWADASTSGGINDVVQSAIDRPFGGGAVAVMGVGLILFGVYGVTEALWRHVPDGESA